MNAATAIREVFSLEDFLANPPIYTEWVDGELVEKNVINLPQGEIQLNLGSCWRNYAISSRVEKSRLTPLAARISKRAVLMLLI